MTKTFSPIDMFNGLMALCTDKEKKFVFNDYKADETRSYRVFTYQIPKFMDFAKPFAKESRGSMFLINTATGAMESLVCIPMQKFFTYGENDNTKYIHLEDVKRVMIKPDGSLISSYTDLDGELAFKSKKMPAKNSELNEILFSALSTELISEIKQLSLTHTVDLELTSPLNRVILEYKEASVTVLKARSLTTGEALELFSDEVKSLYPHIHAALPKLYSLDTIKDLNSKDKFLNLKDIEGLVIEMNNGEMYKVKTMYYLSQNRFANIQDFSKYDQLLVEAAIEETFDELRTLFHYRNRSENYGISEILSRMEIIEEKVANSYNPFVSLINDFYSEHKDLPIKDYIQKINEKEMKQYFNLLMPMYKGDRTNLKSFYMKTIGNHIKST